MTLREDIFAALTSGSPIPMRAYPDTLPSLVTLPALTFFIVSGTDEFHLGGRAGLVSRLLQIDAWGATRGGAEALANEALRLLSAATAFSVTGIGVSGAEPFEPETQRYRSSYEVSIWAEVAL